MNVYIFGGNGFIGQHLIQYLKLIRAKIFVLDIKNNVQKKNNDANYINCDVRNKIDIKVNKNVKNIIFNLAAIHTTPGHEDLEYFETNIKGAKNICKFAESNSIDTIIFTSSISPYGSSEIMKNEDSLPTPNTPYGISKLVAEHVHCQWQSREPNKRKLIILRPGVVFGTSENGNFSRLYKMMSKNIFFYAGRKNTKKACIYVKDLVEAMVLMEEKLSTGVHKYNMCYPQPFSIETICKAISRATGTRLPIIVFPGNLLILLAFIIYYSSRIVGVNKLGIHPDRVKKLMVSTNISGEKLKKLGYELRDFETAIRDWFIDCKSKGLD